jgi:hypothetical protein
MPVILGLGWLVSQLIVIATMAITFIGAVATKKLLIATFFSTFYIASITALFVCVITILQAMAPIIPAELATASSLVVPSNLAAAISTIITAYICRFLFHVQKLLLEKFLF